MKPFIGLPLLALASTAGLGAALLTDDDLAPRGGDFGDAALSRLRSDPSAIDDFLADRLVSDAVDINLDEFIRPLADDDHPEEPTLTIYQLISRHPHATKWAALIDEHQDLVELLNGTKTHHTVFVPDDAAVDHLPFEGEPPKGWIRRALEYHIAPDVYTAHDLAKADTLPTILKEDWLAGKPQRLRSSVSFRGFRLNFFSKIIRPNIRATNGIVHAIDRVICPPAMVGRELSLVPSLFSTLLLAYEKTDFVKFIHHIKMEGSTVFAPTNRAFSRLGPKANAFLFNTDKGKVILKALLKYQIAANVTLYSDAVYGYTDEHSATGGKSHDHYDLKTLLHEKRVAVDVDRFGPFVSVKVNGRTPVVIRDVVAKNGVIQVVGKVPIPPHKHHHDDDDDDDDDGDEEEEISVEELIERLWDYVDEQEQVGWSNEL